ncbi:MAG: phospho-sugar mutase [Erysipelotrichaceae bacterium]|nr:phospho-sugar mutase [Erysipelotrichaceae bacterium]
MDKYNQWLSFPLLDTKLKTELLLMSEKDRYDAFYTNLTFGTAGMRGLLGPGSNRMNIYTIRKANIGLAEFIRKRGPEACRRGVAIAYDNRFMSKEFAYESARVLAMADIRSYVFDSLRPTPELSFAVRYLHCFSGIVITASHNPKEYNGYKIYDENGCQMIPEYVAEIVPYIEAIADELQIAVRLTDQQEKLITTIGAEVDKPYYREVLSIQQNPQLDKRDVKIIFTPQHGTALKAVEAVFDAAGYHYINVAEQCSPDPAFSNTKTPNPEQPEAYDLALQYAKRYDADLVLSTDPDADRIGIAVKQHGSYQLMTGNQTGAVLLEYVFSQYRQHQKMPAHPIMFNTIVTSDLGEKVADKYGVKTEKTLTGFKFIGDRIAHYEKNQKYDFVFGYEESYGYLLKPFVRDKDAVQACLIIAEAAVYYRQQGKTLWDVLLSLYDELGWYEESQVSISGQGADGAIMIQNIMNSLRANPPLQINGTKVIRREDYLCSTADADGQQQQLCLPQADVLKYFLADGCWIAVRPSGTEPKCKIYYCICGNNAAELKQRDQAYKTAFAQLIKK